MARTLVPGAAQLWARPGWGVKSAVGRGNQRRKKGPAVVTSGVYRAARFQVSSDHSCRRVQARPDAVLPGAERPAPRSAHQARKERRSDSACLREKPFEPGQAGSHREPQLIGEWQKTIGRD
jgi:hypothetical protein